jgi:hypothetical protein
MVDYYYFSEMPYPETPELDQYPSKEVLPALRKELTEK